ncbi:carbon-nitrogen hydrolase family protein [Jiangella alba]|uniref:Predicted amidohydrolase n=1 Tax=Jiangella alba TaxID=561176 RepID=A0A1H5PYX4_9ACTN|nr:carbon-nitrogen hydrolase family protein [Jiangella alba]SEF18391.1 Predicted amidohydrolase [Jiangella alba]
MTVRVAAVQLEAVPGDVSRNVAAAARWAGRAVAAGADLVVLPEAVPTGYDATAFGGELPTLDDTGWLAPVQEVVDAAGVVVVLNSALDRGDRRTLTSLVLTPGRQPSPAYDKQHLFQQETQVFTAGPNGAGFHLAGVEFALSVCYDANFPEHAAAAAADGALVYVNSGAYFPGGGHRRDLHKAARALDKGMYVVFSGLVGAPSDFIGGSAVYDPLGRPLVRLGAEEGVAVAEIDPAVVARTRADQRMWSDRRPSLGTRVRRSL